ncbi:hypothetical protein [Salinibacter grassmerensis]|uniref:hypothetical protein n=1 Tax=Salinibacter grassmerensis TaxID=3040353 RepID=UPI0021E6F12B|nr:hypothetical protein [Salinibacter grassmerensis]
MNEPEQRPSASAGQAAAFLSEAADAVEQTIVPALQEALLEVAEEPAFALEMSLFEGRDDATIASTMGISEEDVRKLQKEAREQLLKTEFGQETGRKDLRDMLRLAGVYLRQQSNSKQFQEGFSKALEKEKRPIIEQISEPMEELWKRVADELDATADQLIGTGTALVEGFGPTRAMAASSGSGREREERSFEISIEHQNHVTLIREATGQWRSIFEVHGEDLEAVSLGYQIVGEDNTVFYEGDVHLEKFSEGIYGGGEMIGSLEAPGGASLKMRAIEVKLEEN